MTAPMAQPPVTELVPQLGRDQLAWLIAQQLAVGNYLDTPLSGEAATVRSYQSNVDLWRDVLSERLGAPSVVALERFRLSEWVPFSPGVFHTEEGRQQRSLAQRELLSDPEREISRGNLDRILGRHPTGVEAGVLHLTRIYNPHGKAQMIHGGVGSIRLKPRTIEGGQMWFMSASSTRVAHEGFVVAVPSGLYQGVIDEVRERGTACCTLTGTLCFVENTLRELYGPGVPQVYLRVEALERDAGGSSEDFLVSVPVGFEAAEGAHHLAYASFRSGEPGSLDRAVDWLEDTYVHELFAGRVITDFDEQVQRFGGAVFSLDKTMTGRVDIGAIQELRLDARVMNVILQQAHHVSAERIEHVHQENKVINVGAGATINAPVIVADTIQGSFNTIDSSAASEELKQALRELATAVAAAALEAPPDQAQQMADDLETVTREATKPTPRASWVRVGLDSLREAAQALGDVGVPILEIAAKVLPLVL